MDHISSGSLIEYQNENDSDLDKLNGQNEKNYRSSEKRARTERSVSDKYEILKFYDSIIDQKSAKTRKFSCLVFIF